MHKKIICVAQSGGNFLISGKRITDSTPVVLELNRVTRRHLSDGSIVEYRETKPKKKPGPKPTRGSGVEDILDGLSDSNDTKGE